MTLLADRHHFVRFCKHWQYQANEVLASAFTLRPDESDLSGDHYEHYSTDNYEQIVKSMKARHFNPNPKGYLLKLNCGAVKAELLRFCDVCFEKTHADNSHTSLIGLSDSNNAYAGKLALLVMDFVIAGSVESSQAS
jgi:hypothetical protein